MKARKLKSKTRRWNILKRLDFMTDIRHNKCTMKTDGTILTGPCGYKRVDSVKHQCEKAYRNWLYQ